MNSIKAINQQINSVLLSFDCLRLTFYIPQFSRFRTLATLSITDLYLIIIELFFCGSFIAFLNQFDFSAQPHIVFEKKKNQDTLEALTIFYFQGDKCKSQSKLDVWDWRLLNYLKHYGKWIAFMTIISNKVEDDYFERTLVSESPFPIYYEIIHAVKTSSALCPKAAQQKGFTNYNTEINKKSSRFASQNQQIKQQEHLRTLEFQVFGIKQPLIAVLNNISSKYVCRILKVEQLTFQDRPTNQIMLIFVQKQIMKIKISNFRSLKSMFLRNHIRSIPSIFG